MYCRLDFALHLHLLLPQSLHTLGQVHCLQHLLRNRSTLLLLRILLLQSLLLQSLLLPHLAHCQKNFHLPTLTLHCSFISYQYCSGLLSILHNYTLVLRVAFVLLESIANHSFWSFLVFILLHSFLDFLTHFLNVCNLALMVIVENILQNLQ